MKPSLLAILICPFCPDSGTLGLEADELQDGDVFAGRLACSACERVYPIHDGVPRMLTGDESAQTKAAFTRQWELRYQGAFESENRVFWLDNRQMVAYLGDHIVPDPTPGSWILDAGCGSGEKAIALAERHPGLQVVAMDFSETLGVLAQRARALPNLHIVQGDVTRPPLVPATFATMISLGVLHHTPDTLLAFTSLVRLGTPDLRLVTWLYPHPDESPAFNKFYYWFRDVLFLARGHNLPAPVRLWLVRFLCVPIFLALPLFLLSGVLAKGMYRSLSVDELYRGLVFMLYDNLAPRYQHRHKQDEVFGWYRDQGFAQVAQKEFGLYVGVREA